MKRLSVVLMFITSMLASLPGQTAEVFQKDDVGVSLDGRLQLLGFGQLLEDVHRSDARAYLFLKQARLGTQARYGDYRFALMLALGGEEEVKAPSPGVSLSLLDCYADVPVRLLDETYLRVGQFKIPYSRERLLESGFLSFADRSIQNLGFRMGRDVGVAAVGRRGSAMGTFGVFAGGGRDVPERYLPERLGSPLLVLRAGFDNEVEKAKSAGPRFAAFLNALYLKDSLVGHSTVLNVKPTERSLLLNSSWNPYLGQGPLLKGELFQGGVDALVQVPVGAGVLGAELEANYGAYANEYGHVNLTGGRAQFGYAWQEFEALVRYAVLFPRDSFAIGGNQVTGTTPIHEVTPAFVYRVKNRPLKLIVDFPVLLRAPVVNEAGVGAYVLTEHPDQASLLKPGGPGAVTRQTVVEARVLLQAGF